jgi:hypothetical protein
MVIEKNGQEYGLTEEIAEFYDGKDNLGISVTTLGGARVITYSYYDINELLLVKGTECVTKMLNESVGLTPFFLVVDQSGKEHIVTSISQLFNSATFQFKYIGGGNSVRGIIVNEWQACFYDKKSGQTSRITISYSSIKLLFSSRLFLLTSKVTQPNTDPDKWLPAELSVTDTDKSVPVQVLIESIDSANKTNVIYYSITQFKRTLSAKIDYLVVCVFLKWSAIIIRNKSCVFCLASAWNLLQR